MGKNDKLRTSLRISGNPGVEFGCSRAGKTGTPSAFAIQNWPTPAHAPTGCVLGMPCPLLMTAGFQSCEACPGQCLAFYSWELNIDHKFMSSSFQKQNTDFSPQL